MVVTLIYETICALHVNLLAKIFFLVSYWLNWQKMEFYVKKKKWKIKANK